jgi:hypothetical protein
MRDTRINVLYYPEMLAAQATLKKAILLSDELHFIERPSFSFRRGRGRGDLIRRPYPYFADPFPRFYPWVACTAVNAMV